jgi:GNAT superfamily N-acetyltransferase
MRYRLGEIEDCEQLTELRLAMRKERDLTFSEDVLRLNTLNFFRINIARGSHISFVCEHNGQIIATAGLTLFEMPPTDKLLNGKVAKLMNMYTVPNYRRNGIATKMLEFVMEYAREHEYYKIMLNTSPMGKKLYENFGFSLIEGEYEYQIL